MQAVTRTLIQEITLVAKALGLLSETVDSDRARRALLFSVETLGHVEQRMVDLECLIRIKSIELEACRSELARLLQDAPQATDRPDDALIGLADPVA